MQSLKKSADAANGVYLKGDRWDGAISRAHRLTCAKSRRGQTGYVNKEKEKLRQKHTHGGEGGDITPPSLVGL